MNKDDSLFTDMKWKNLITITNPYAPNETLLWLDPKNEFSINNFPTVPNFDFDIKQDIIEQSLDLPLNYAIIDCGAHVGDGAIPIAHALKSLNRSDIMVYAIDPSLYKCEVMKYIVEKNNLKNITIINCGLSDKNEEYYKQRTDNDNTGASVWYKYNNIEKYDEKISFYTLDTIVEKYNIDNIGIIHLDVESMEVPAIKGAINIINKSKPYMSLENNGENANDNNYYLQFLPDGYKYVYNKAENNCFKYTS